MCPFVFPLCIGRNFCFILFLIFFSFFCVCMLLLAIRLFLFENHYCYEYCDVTNLIFIHEIYIHVYICNVLGEFMYICENNKRWILIQLEKIGFICINTTTDGYWLFCYFRRPLLHNLLSPSSKKGWVLWCIFGILIFLKDLKDVFFPTFFPFLGK